MSNCLDQDQDRSSVGPDLGPICLQRLSADGKSRRYQEKSYYYIGKASLILKEIIN